MILLSHGRQGQCIMDDLLHQLQLLFLEWLTPGGGGPLVQTTLKLSWSTLEELGERASYRAQGGAAEVICLPDDPDYINGSIDLSFTVYKSVVQGAEYEINIGSPIVHLHEQNAPCAVCDVPTRARVIVVPAKTVCPPSWTREYYGYLMAAYDGYYRSSYTCIDIDPEEVPGESSDTDPSLFHHTVTNCNGLLCPPYENNCQLSCVVCTKWFLYL